MRREGLRPKNNWGKNNPEYNVERYRKHYFYSDFDYLKTKFQNGHAPQAMILFYKGTASQQHGPANLVEMCLNKAKKDHPGDSEYNNDSKAQVYWIHNEKVNTVHCSPTFDSKKAEEEA